MRKPEGGQIGVRGGEKVEEGRESKRGEGGTPLSPDQLIQSRREGGTKHFS